MNIIGYFGLATVALLLIIASISTFARSLNELLVLPLKKGMNIEL